ncbi:hypothetical protein ACH50O_11500 [Methylomonas sp. 2BW1-5-20]|uniref:hypothetical protein n=1 Tax=Methylomonas sp. 2BW1-5-20 TaxID=3376686 RepID=UPI00404C7558
MLKSVKVSIAMPITVARVRAGIADIEVLHWWMPAISVCLVIGNSIGTLRILSLAEEAA